LWHETRVTECKTAVNWVSKSIRSLARRKALEQWKTRIPNTDAIAQAIWIIAKSLINRDGPRAPAAIHGTLGLKFHPIDTTKGTADCLENQFTQHD
jgi:hypothetical protein